MKNLALNLGKITTQGLKKVSIPTTIGRYEPPHEGHGIVLENLRSKSSILQDPDPEFNHLPPALIMVGSSGENRNLLKNPFTFEQRVEMLGLVAPWLPKTADPRNNPAFLPYVGTYDNIKPPSLERMAEQLKNHCEKHQIPLEFLTPVILIKADDKQDFQIYGKTYPKSHQMSVLAQGLGLRFFEEDVVMSKETIHATNIRKNLPENFNSLNPQVFRYIQKELMLAHLNSREVGASQADDKYTNAEEALRELVKEDRMLSLDVTKAQVVTIPPERKNLFLKYMGSDYISAPTTTPTTKISSTLQQSFEKVIISEGDIIKGTVQAGKDQLEIKHGSLQMTIDPHILRDGTVTLSDKERKFLNEVNKSKDQDFARNLQTAIDSKEIDLNATDSTGKTLLDLAAQKGLIQTTKMLLDKGINFPIMARGPQNSPLHKAAMGATKSLSSTYPDSAEIGNILVDHSGKLSATGKVINNPTEAKNNDDFEAKKDKLLRSDIFASNTVPTTEEKRQEFREKIFNDGAEVKKSSAVFLTITEDGEETHFLKKSKCVGVETKYGSDLFRTLSKKHYGAKREFLIADDEGRISTLIKFDPNLSRESFLNRALKSLPDFDTGLAQNKEFLTGYSRMCGVMHVLGEPDRNLENFLVSETNGRPIKIDNGFLVNFQKYPFGDIYQNNGRAQSRNSDYPHEYVTYDVTPQDRFKIYGSAQSRDFLVCTLAGEKYQNMQALIDEAKVNFGQEETTKNLTVLANSYIKAYNLGLDDVLFDKIKDNISQPKNKHLQAAFMAFMSGINDTINLSKDDKFLDAYTSKYAEEGGENVGILAQQCKRIFKENSQEAQQQFAKLLDHFNDLRNQPEYAADYGDDSKSNSTSIKPISSDKVVASNTLYRNCP